jgi:hypothetical protein
MITIIPMITPQKEILPSSTTYQKSNRNSSVVRRHPASSYGTRKTNPGDMTLNSVGWGNRFHPLEVSAADGVGFEP